MFVSLSPATLLPAFFSFPSFFPPFPTVPPLIFMPVFACFDVCDLLLSLTPVVCMSMGVGLFTGCRQLTRVTPLEKMTPPAHGAISSVGILVQRGQRRRAPHQAAQKWIRALVREFSSTALTNDHKHLNTA